MAAFDFDGTISRRDTLLRFLVRVGGPVRVGGALARHGTGLARGLRDDDTRDATKALVLGRVLAGRTHRDLEAAGEAYAELLHPRLRPEAIERISWHRRQGHRCVIVSASLSYYLRPLARRLELDDVLCVEMALDSAGRLTGALAGPNVRGPQKAVRLRGWMQDRLGADTVGAEIWAYGDSSGDEALLAMADHPTWCGRRAGR